MDRRLTALLLSLPLLASCGPERDFSGIWRQTACDDALSRTDCNGFVYELHLGRYGDRLAGIVVRYVYDRGGFDSFQRPQEYGCFLIEGGVARDDSMLFRLYDAETPRYPQPEARDDEPVNPRSEPRGTCAGRRFDIAGDDEVMTGVTDCGDADGDSLPIAFEAVVGQPRTECYERIGTSP